VERLTGWELVDPGGVAADSQAADSQAADSRAADPRATDPRAVGSRAVGAATPLTPTPEQEQAIARRGEPLLLAAGAGSGKTSVLVERFVRAVREDGIAPGRILAITFTERAAGELRERVRARLLALGEPAAAHAIEEAYVGTFHGFCARVLRAHAREVGIHAEFEILDEGLSGRLRRQAFTAALGAFLEGDRVEAVDLIAAYGADRARATVLGVYAELRSRGQRVPRLPTPEPGRAPAGQAELDLEAADMDARDRWEARAAVDAQGARAVALWGELLERFGERYEDAKQARHGFDFDDLELLAGELLARDGGVRAAWAERFELLMVDELQDVNPRQLALVQALERDNLFTVGDEWQSIYGFRHADVGLFRAREAELAPRGQSLRLTRNFRARPELLEAVNAVFAGRFGEAFTPLRAGRERARVREAHDERHDGPDEEARDVMHGETYAGTHGETYAGTYGETYAGTHGETYAEMYAEMYAEPPRVELLLTDRRGWNGERAPVAAGGSGSGAAPWRQAEARALARRVGELVRDGQASPGGVAVLLRAVGDIECYEQALRAQGLHTVASAGAFWARQEVADLLAYLRALADPLDEVALYGVLASPPIGLSSDALGLLARAAQAQERSVWEVARDPDSEGDEGDGATAHGDRGEDQDDQLRRERTRAAELCAWLEQERELAPELELAALLERAIEHGDHVARLRAGEDGERRLANVRKLVELAREWERSDGRDLRGFLDEAAFQQGVGGGYLVSAEAIAEPDASVEGETSSQDAVRLMSVHAAKGLEFDVVCVADLGRAPSMGVPDLLVTGERIGVRLVGLVDPEPRPALDYAQLASERREAQAEEEDRIVYVAMTRARERLLLSGAVDFASWPRERPGAPPIAWLGPALAADLPARCAEAVRPDPQDVSDSDSDSAVASARPVADRPTPVLRVDGTDISLRCRLNTPVRSL
jgi:ATP-dependent helicase/nuclease subunit A